MGVVYAGYDDALQRDVAIKLLRTDASARSAALLREARAAARITHPSVCTIYEVGEHEGAPFLVMELLDGETRGGATRAGRRGPFEACAILVPTLDALDALHREGLVHLDIKPANIFITSHGVKLLDFGLARAQSVSDPTSTSSSAGLLAGTPAYMAPEQVRSEPVDARTDIFAAGVLLFELVTGERPFRGATFVDVLQAVLTEHPPALSGSAALVAIDRVVQRALAKDPRIASPPRRRWPTELRRVADLPRDALPVRIKRLKRIAVLPFRLLRPDPEIDFLGSASPTPWARRSPATTTWSSARRWHCRRRWRTIDDVRRAGASWTRTSCSPARVLRSGAAGSRVGSARRRRHRPRQVGAADRRIARRSVRACRTTSRAP